MDPISQAVAEKAIAKILDVGLAALQAGIEREPIVAKVREMEEQGATPDAITDALQAMRQESEAAAQKAIDQAV